jgi:hypothetical protein
MFVSSDEKYSSLHLGNLKFLLFFAAIHLAATQFWNCAAPPAISGTGLS